jgi:hypothetical protein
MPSNHAMNKYPLKKDSDGGFLELRRQTKRGSFDEGAMFALRKVAEEHRGRVIWPGDLLKIAEDWIDD